MRWLQAAEVVVLGLWAGAWLTFGALIAPWLFRIVPSRQMAGDVAAAATWNIGLFGLAAGTLALISLLRRRHKRAALIAAAMAVAALNLGWVRGNLNRAQAQMTRPIEQYAISDPLRVEYNVWHNWSTRLGSVELLLIAGALVWAAADRREG